MYVTVNLGVALNPGAPLPGVPGVGIISMVAGQPPMSGIIIRDNTKDTLRVSLDNTDECINIISAVYPTSIHNFGHCKFSVYVLVTI